MNPVIGVPGSRCRGHCGACSKCRERHDAFLDAGVEDPTEYASVRVYDGQAKTSTTH